VDVTFQHGTQIGWVPSLCGDLSFVNLAIGIDTLSRRVFAHGRASKYCCSTSTKSFDNALGEQIHNGLLFNI
jgi:hypothetical protein